MWLSWALCLIALLVAPSAAQEMSSETPSTTTALPATLKGPRYPYIVSIGSNEKGYNKHLCVGVIISNEHVLSAAHCIKSQKKDKLYVSGGDDWLNSRTQKQTRFVVVQVIWHPQFKELGGHDIALVKVHPSFPLDNIRFRSIDFASKIQIGGGVSASLLGWGRVKMNQVRKLKELPFLTMENSLCKLRHRFIFLTETDICAMHLKGPVGACDGDSGGPLMDVVKEKIYGILSYGKKACKPNQPYAFTRVNIYSDWIEKTMGKMKINISMVNRTKREDIKRRGR
ncbi:trypsin eta [Drosophila ficusphila]|uniref:trypsin eta n=1 Tax=Drosophila ficusphila TaxID=30025 RepID=UPI001C89B360|nr:trypsin eta [Drosophila ficusphila]